MSDWIGKVVLVTGGTSGIGRSAVERFARGGADVFFCGRRESLGNSIADEIGDNVRFIKIDVEREEEFASFIDAAVSQLGKVDVLFNNAGGPAAAGTIDEISSDEFDQACRVIFRSVFYGVKHISPIMKKAGQGAIISNASVAGYLGGYATSHIYAALKAAIIQFSKSVALELAEHGVRVNTVSPGAISTGIFGRGAGLESDAADASAAKVERMLKKAQPLNRSGVPEDVAAAVEFLASDDAAFITGRDLVVDGGMIAGRRFSEVEAGRLAMRKALEAD